MKVKNLKPPHIFYFLLMTIVLQLFFTFPLKAERFSYTTYSISDGLANDDVNKIVADSRGFLWFCTSDGLSRFDGYKFKNYTQDEGLSHRNINDFLETKDGTYLVATSRGIAVFNPNGKAYHWNILTNVLEQNSSEPPLFKTYYSNNSTDKTISQAITGIVQASDGKIYAGTNHALYRFEKTGEDWKFSEVEFPDWKDKRHIFNGLFNDSKGGLWLATNLAIYRMSKDGTIKKINESGGGAVFESRDGKIWVDSGGNDVGIRIYAFPNSGDTPFLETTFTKKDGLPSNGFTNAVLQTSDKQIFINSEGTLLRFVPDAKPGETKFQPTGLNSVTTSTLYQNQSMWLGFQGKGVGKFTAENFKIFDQRENVPDRISSIFLSRQGDIFLTSGHKLFRVGDGKVENIQPLGLKPRSWGATYLDFQSKDGDWWIPTGEGLFRYKNIKNFSDLAQTSPSKIYTTADGFDNNAFFRIFEDSRGDIWISTIGSKHCLHRWEKATEKIIKYTNESSLPTDSMINSFGEDAAGNIWLSFYGGELVRYKDGKFRSFTDENLFTRSGISTMLSDSKGRFWLASISRGLFRIDEPNAETPTFTNFSTSQGLSSNQTFSLVEDKFGRIYVGTGRGITRLEPEINRIKIYTTSDGLPSNLIWYSVKDQDENLWFSSNSSITKYIPLADKPTTPPPIFIDGISVNGVVKTISDLGETEIKNLEFASDERQIQVSFFAISFESGESLRYQYKLGNQDWSTPADQRSVSFNLSSGNYDFAVQAINSDGTVSEKTATFSFKILPPVWQRGWFIALAILTLGGAIFALDRYRVTKTRQVEKALDDTRRANTMIRESEIRFRTLADTASDAILTIDKDSNIIFVNQAIEKVFGYRAEELIGKKMTMLMPARMREGHNGGLNRYLTTNKKNINWEGVPLTGLHKEGHEIPLEVSFGEFEREGNRYFTGIARDISERKRAEAELQKAREEKFKELERVRTRIATDLHDDIGSSLTQIAVLSEVARGQAIPLKSESLMMPLERIKNVSKELVAVMSDVVWAINPNKDTLPDLVQRMRRFASDVFSGKGIKFEFHTPEIEDNLQLGANIRREVFAIFKESVNNTVKYSECIRVVVDFKIENEWLNLKISDDGKGFDTVEILSENFKPEMGGNGLVNMRRRAKDLGGECEIQSEANKGTAIILSIPLRPQENFLLSSNNLK